MGTLKDNIQREVHLLEPTSLEHAFIMVRKVGSKNMATRRVATKNYREHHFPSPSLTQTTRLTPQQMDKIREHGYVSIVTSTIMSINVSHEEEDDQEL
jgi:hypothetical protein